MVLLGGGTGTGPDGNGPDGKGPEGGGPEGNDPDGGCPAGNGTEVECDVPAAAAGGDGTTTCTDVGAARMLCCELVRWDSGDSVSSSPSVMGLRPSFNVLTSRRPTLP